jgi:DNA-binding NarL/FixJ family response regulator
MFDSVSAVDRLRVVIVDNEAIGRLGMSAVLSSDPRLDVVGVYDHEESMLPERSWWDVDVAVVDAADDQLPGDQFPGVTVVQTIRAQSPPGRVSIVVITGHFFDDALRRRMREAKADYFYHRSALAEPERLIAAVLAPPVAQNLVPPEADVEMLDRLGIKHATAVNAAVAWACRHSHLGGIIPPGSGRRQADGLRRNFNRVAQLEPRNHDGTPPNRHQDAPSHPQIQRFLDWATKVKHY